jgi:predicted HTH transcriptional regulator
VGISLRKIKENILKLKAKGFLERIGPDKGGYWKVKVAFPFGENIMENAGEGESENAAGIEKVTEKVTEEVTEKVTVKVTEEVTENQQIILNNISKEPRLTLDELAKIVGISLRKIK